MSISRAYSPVLHFDDKLGHPLANGMLCTYAGGTYTEIATYKNSDKVLNESTIRLNSRGECRVWLEDGVEYRFVLKDSSGAVIWDEDKVSSASVSGEGVSPIKGVKVYLDSQTGTPSATTDYTDGVLTIYFSCLKGEKGDQGEQGEKGDKGDTGAIGATGATGPQGPRGEKGEDGEKGDAGTAATIEVGEVTTGDAGTSATVENVGSTTAAKFNFTIPRGEKGEKGDKGDSPTSVYYVGYQLLFPSSATQTFSQSVPLKIVPPSNSVSTGSVYDSSTKLFYLVPGIWHVSISGDIKAASKSIYMEQASIQLLSGAGDDVGGFGSALINVDGTMPSVKAHFNIDKDIAVQSTAKSGCYFYATADTSEIDFELIVRNMSLVRVCDI